MEREIPLVDRQYLLEKYPGKGGWTYASIPEVLQNKHAPFGWVKVKGFIDNVEIKNYKLMPMGNSQLFLPVKAAIRKQIGKNEGDWVHVILYADKDSIEIPSELLLCLEEEPMAYKSFFSYTEGQQNEFIDWIYSAKRKETQVERIVVVLDKLIKGLKHRDKF
jgi:hypothetical protein